ncbi:MAG TPA: response regulator [Steroidobacteraceae bacterium]|nr:response regulator [Steroidobacteraceae bacterium]
MTQPVPANGPAAPIAYLVDDNEPFRRSTSLLLETAFIDVRGFDSGAALLAQLEREPAPRAGACVVSDIRMPQMSGLVLMEELQRREQSLRVIFVTAHADVPLAVEAMRRGAVDFIEKPFEARLLIQAIRLASVEEPPQQSRDTGSVTEPDSRLSVLTRRERQVIELVVAGKFNKSIADILGISTKTVELHRASLMSKLGVRNLPDLVKVYLGYR